LPVEIDEDVREEYWREIRNKPEWDLGRLPDSRPARPNGTERSKPPADGILIGWTGWESV
jgi:hypothetical protein